LHTEDASFTDAPPNLTTNMPACFYRFSISVCYKIKQANNSEKPHCSCLKYFIMHTISD